ncbi:MAG: cwp20 [Anaerocolumna sp.]|jgi:CubicO group peptidase (beta-lactamase class C family)|nr:cwp20 [Anaerocolumna sp.]
MKKRFLQSSLSLVLALSLALIPQSSAIAKTYDYSQVKVSIGAETTDSISVTTDYTDVKKLADKKATILTSIYGVTSIQYALIDNGEIVLSNHSGVYSKDDKSPLTENNMYGIGSISKVFTTTAVMQLVEQGKIDLDKPVVDYIPEFKMADPRYKDITVRMLLNHSSGLMGSTLDNALLFDDTDFTTYQNFLKILETQRLKANPGEFSVYCNDGFTLAEIVVEKVSGISFTEYINKYISNPLGLNNTKTPLDEFDKNQLAKTYFNGNKTTLPVDSLNMIGAGGMYSSAENLCKFSEIFMDSTNSTVLENTSVKDMENPEYRNGFWAAETDSVIGYGLGWDSVNTYPFGQYGIKALSKGGDTLLFHGNLTVLPEENMAIAVLSSGGASSYDQILAQEILLSALKAKGTIGSIIPNKTSTKPTAVEMPIELKKYEGIYGSMNSVLKVEISDDGILKISDAITPGAGTQKFTYTGNGRFYFTDGSVYVSFKEESNGNTYLYCAGFANLPSLGQTVTDGYQGQKLDDNVISKELLATWEKRENKKYFMVSEKYSSQVYAAGSLSIKISLLDDIQGYCLNTAIVNENTSKSTIKIPGVYGRDLNDFTFFKIGNAEYLDAGGSICITEDAINPLPTKSKFTTKIGAYGYANWFKIDKNSANKKITVAHPKNSAFAVYDEYESCVYYSYISKENTVTLPKNGYIVFVGDPKAKFTVKYIN